MKSTFHGLRIAVLALGCYWALLFVSTHIPAHLLVTLHQSDKVIHATAFAILAFLIAWAVPTNDARPLRNVFQAALIAVIYAGIDELSQIPVGRTADWNDFFADCTGICVGLSLYTLIRGFLFKLGIKFIQDPIQNR